MIIWIVDDEPAWRDRAQKVANRVLGSQRFTSAPIADFMPPDGKAAPTVIILDLYHEGKDLGDRLSGIDFYDRLRREHPRPGPFVIVWSNVYGGSAAWKAIQARRGDPRLTVASPKIESALEEHLRECIQRLAEE